MWVKVTAAELTAASKYTFKVRTKAAGRFVYRVSIAAIGARPRHQLDGYGHRDVTWVVAVVVGGDRSEFVCAQTVPSGLRLPANQLRRAAAVRQRSEAGWTPRDGAEVSHRRAAVA